MGFKQVFYALREVFPQVDLRILKAVASQYSSDVDAAVEFVLSDVIPAVSEPTEAHYTLQDIDHTDSWSNGTFPDYNLSHGYGGQLYNNNLEECSRIEDKVVINETRITPTVDYDQVGASSVSTTKPPIIDYEQSTLTAFVNHCTMEKGKMSSLVEKIADEKHFYGNRNLLDSHVSPGSLSPMYDQSPSDSAVKDKKKMPLKLPKAENKQDFSESDKYNLGNLFANFCPTENGHASVNLVCASNVHMPSESGDNYELQGLFEQEMPLKLCEAESLFHSSKSEVNYNFDTLFAEFCSSKDRQIMDTLPSAPAVQRLCESGDSYDLQVLFEKQMPLRLSTAQSTHDISKSKDNYDFQVLFEDSESGGKEFDMLHAAEITPAVHKKEDNLHGKPCTTDSTTQASRLLIQDEYQQSSYKLEDRCSSSELFASSRVVDSSLQTFEEKDSSHTPDIEEKPFTDFTNALTFICNSNDDFNLSKLPSSTTNVSLSEVSQCRVRRESEQEIMCFNSVDKHSIVPVIVHETYPHNEKKLTAGADKYEQYLDITTPSYQIAGINKLVADITNSKEALSSLYEETRRKVNELELQEEKSRKAKQDAVKARQGFVAMVQNYNNLIENSKESNDKRAQIVRGEKSLLATLAQDLQSRLSKLSAERDDALTIVEEIKFALDSRLATLTEEETAAREQINQGEKLALLVCEEKEAEMGSIMVESMKLQQEADENILLKKFLMDREHIIDILQEEISSIREKVVALNERTLRSKLQSTLVTTSSSASSPIPECKTPSPDRPWTLENQNENGILNREKMVESHAKDLEGLSDDEWEMLETTQV
ncbi:hypothetical protein EJB05_30329 [Eragrostis curvula]|uniref:CUE domain-containing protein n=1 Tax=Eragrostis curvula TaxID=38414 RepID=A0A5J9UB59_9POAL|nr:hypothetical protein EJB05_30329 [Eragrostis curvula]